MSTSVLKPRQGALLELLASEMSSRLLQQISEADYGCRVRENLEQLRCICKTLIVPEPLQWVPREVLELIRWSRPEQEDWKPGLPGRDGHLIRAFCCTVLVIGGGNKTTREYVDDENSTLAPLVESLLVLGPEYQVAGLSELAWRLENPPQAWSDEPFFWLAALLLAAGLRDTVRPDLLPDLSRRVLESERAVREQDWHISEDEQLWLFGLTFFNLRQDIWVGLARHLRKAASGLPTSVAAELAQIAELLERGRSGSVSG